MTLLPCRETCHPLSHGQRRGVYASILRSAISSQLEKRNATIFVCSEYRRGPGISVTALLQQLQWPSLADRRLIARLTLFYNVHTGKINIPLCNLLDRSDSRTRGANKNYKYISTKKHCLWSIILSENSKRLE